MDIITYFLIYAHARRISAGEPTPDDFKDAIVEIFCEEKDLTDKEIDDIYMQFVGAR